MPTIPPKDAPVALADILKAELGRLTHPRLLFTVSLNSSWPGLVGKTIAKHSRVLFVAEHEVCIGVDNSVWMAELNARKDEILARVHTAFPNRSVRSLRFKIAPTHSSGNKLI